MSRMASIHEAQPILGCYRQRCVRRESAFVDGWAHRVIYDRGVVENTRLYFDELENI